MPTPFRIPTTRCWLRALGASLATLLAAIMLACGGAKPTGNDSDPDPGPAIDGNGAARDYEENSVAADRKYLGKRIRVTKQGVKVGRDEESGAAYVTSPVEYGATSTTRDGTAMIFYFDKSDEEPIAGIKQKWPPQSVTIEGICRGKGSKFVQSFVVVENCKVIKIE